MYSVYCYTTVKLVIEEWWNSSIHDMTCERIHSPLNFRLIFLISFLVSTLILSELSVIHHGYSYIMVIHTSWLFIHHGYSYCIKIKLCFQIRKKWISTLYAAYFLLPYCWPNELPFRSCEYTLTVSDDTRHVLGNHPIFMELKPLCLIIDYQNLTNQLIFWPTV